MVRQTVSLIALGETTCESDEKRGRKEALAHLGMGLFIFYSLLLHQMLVSVFNSRLCDPSTCEPLHPHLRSFAVLVPALTLAYADAVIARREGKKGKETPPTDDGFVMGEIAMILFSWKRLKSNNLRSFDLPQLFFHS